MADVQDVCDSLVSAVAFAVYPDGDFDVAGVRMDKGDSWDQPLTGSIAMTQWNSGVKWNSGRIWNARKIPSVSGTPIVIYPGWPSSAGLAADLTAGKSHITVFPKAEERNTTRYGERQQVIAQPVTTLTFAISGPVIIGSPPDYDIANTTWDANNYDRSTSRHTVITIGGTVSSPQNLALRVNSKFYTHSVQPDDTLPGIATALSALLAVDIAGTTASGPVITLGSTGRLQAARIGGFGTIGTEYRRQERVVMVSIWTPSPVIRKALGSAIDQTLSQIRFLQLPDGYGARLIYKNSLEVDALQKSNLYRRDLNFTVEYPTTVLTQVAAVIAPSVTINESTFTL